MEKVSGGRISEGQGTTLLFCMKCILFSYIITMICLALLALALYKLGLSEGIVSISISGIYVVASFLAGFLAGKRMQNRKFLWGLLMGGMYFLVLAIVSLAVNGSISDLSDSFITTLILCGAGGMMGGMLG